MDNLSYFLNRLENRDTYSQRESWLRGNFDGVLSGVTGMHTIAEEQVRALLGTGRVVDEMAIFVPERNLMFTVLTQALKAGWVAFNYAEDTVETSPIASAYSVEYLFMRKDGVRYRLEIMSKGDGFSPWHSYLEERCNATGEPCVLAHASFKVPSDAEYGAAVVALRSAGYDAVQHCTSSYGRFSYFLNTDTELLNIPVLKPRINTRDTQANDYGR